MQKIFMKRVLFAIAVLGAFLPGCTSDLIDTTEDPVATTADDSDPEEAMGPFDSIDDVNFARTINISWSGSGASVSGDELGIVSVNGSQVTVDSRSHTDIIKYVLSGSSSDGCIKIYSLVKQALVLDGLSLENSGGAAINNQGHKRTFVMLEGSNSLADCAVNASGDYPDETDSEDMKAAFFSEGQLVFSGNGSLKVTAKGKAAITSDDYLRFLGNQTITASSSNGHALRGKDAICVDAGTINASASADGKKAMSSDGSVTIAGGVITLSVSGGVSSSTDADGNIDLSGSAGIKSDGAFSMTGGLLTITNSGQGGKGISGDSTASFSGGTVIISVTGSNYGSSGNNGPGGGGPGGGGGGWPGSRAGWGGNTTSDNNSKSAKGIKFDGDITISGGTVNVSSSSHEAIESKGKLTVSGGILYAYSTSDDAINSAGDMHLTGGLVCGWSTGNDGIDANGNLYIDGATVYAVCTKGSPEVAVDANTEGGKKLYLQSGALVSIGGIENGSSITGSAYSVSSWNTSTWYALNDASGNLQLAFKTPASSSNKTMVLYSGGKTLDLQGGVSVSDGEEIFGGNAVSGSTVSGGSSVNVSAYSGSSGQRW